MKKGKKMTAVALIFVLCINSLTGCSAAAPNPATSTTEAPNQKYASTITSNQEAGQNSETRSAESLNGDYLEDVYGKDNFNTEEYNEIVENKFKTVADNPLSTFSVDVDTAAYTNIRRMIKENQEVEPDAVRIEEMLNYFYYNYTRPEGEIPFSVTTEYSNCPWNADNKLMLIGLQAKDIDFHERPMSNFVFLLDVSGSMHSPDKLPLVQKSFALLTDELTKDDRVSIVTYAGSESVVLEGVSGDQKTSIRDALDSLSAGGSTAGSAGIHKAYELAEKYYISGGNNRVILATDGDLNVGITSEGALKRLIKKKKEAGVHLSVLGFGTGNIKDNKMEALADNGDGNYNYIDSQLEAKKVLVEEMGGTLLTVAKDVKIQVEFNPAEVESYRLIGYENRLLNNEDFEDDTVDAGEIGAGHRVTALYELVPAKADQETKESNLKYQSDRQTIPSEELLTVNIRYKAPNGDESKLTSVPVKTDSFQEVMPDNLKFASAIAEFGMLLINSEWKGTATYEGIIEQISSLPDVKEDNYKAEFLSLVKEMDD